MQPESPLGGGRLDFLVSGTLLSGRSAGVCIEFKNAHSDDLEHGLLTQLPHYMRSKGSDLGIYCVLSYRGQDFDQPKKTPAEIQGQLVAAAADAGLRVRILVLDVGKSPPPSKA